MSSLHFQKDNRSGKGTNKGFYIALGVCLIAIGVAAWTTYDSVVKYANPAQEESTPEQSTPAQQNVSGVFVVDSLPEESSAPSSEEAPVSSAPAISSKPESKPASSKPSEPPSGEVKETAAKPVSYVYPAGEDVLKNFSGENPIFSDTMQDWRVHTGTDFSAKNGDAVKAIAGGKITDSYKDDWYGNILVIEHDGGVTASYCGLGDTLLVKKGEKVKAGQKIGSVTTIPCESADPPHLHLEIKKGGKLIDPMTLFK